MSKRESLYLDTSTISFLFADDVMERRAITRKFFAVLGTGIYRVVISDVVLFEIGRCERPLQQAMLKELESIVHERVGITGEMDDLAERYCRMGIIPRKFRDDALHIAASTVSGCDALVSWNFRHLVKLTTVREVKGVNVMLGYREIEIITPESFV